jgi:hypothetical protein
MTMETRQWRFFTRLEVSDCAVRQIWCWEALDAQHQVVSSAAGFTTLPTAMRNARRHGFDGNENPADGEPRHRRFDDWATGEDLFDRPFGWLDSGRADPDGATRDDAQAARDRGEQRPRAALRVR